MKPKTERIAIYSGREQLYERELVKLQKTRTSTKNKEILQRWHNHLFSTGSGPQRVAKLSSQARKICQLMYVDLVEAKRKDIQELVAYLNRQTHWSEATKADYRRCLKQFYAWFEEEDARLDDQDRKVRREAQALYAYLKKHVARSYQERTINYNEILTDEEVDKVIQNGCKTVKERAFIAVLHEAGVRAGEMLNLRLKDVQHYGDYAVLRVEGKTGQRRVMIVQSLSYLGTWLETHPLKESAQSPLWVGDNVRIGHQPLKHGGAQKLLNRCFERASVDKQHNMHWFRHSRATLLASKMSEAVMCKYFGWSIGSRQIKTYVHIGSGQVDAAVLELHGLTKKEEAQPTRKCSCGAPNRRAAQYCHKCGRPMDVTVAMEESRALKDAMKVLPKILEDPELRDAFKKRMRSYEDPEI